MNDHKQESLTKAQRVALKQRDILLPFFKWDVIDAFGTIDDMRKATDFVAEGIFIVAARYRSQKDWLTYFVGKGEVTIRSRRESGAETEWVKIFDRGLGEWLLYSNLLDDETITDWILIDLNVLRKIKDTPDIVWPCPDENKPENGERVWFQAVPIAALAAIYPELIAASSARGWHGRGGAK